MSFKINPRHQQTLERILAIIPHPHEVPNGIQTPPRLERNSEMLKFLDELLEVVFKLDSEDPITDCPASALAILPTRPDPLIALAHSKLHSYPFDSVPPCWRRLYTDASIVKAIHLIKCNIATIREQLVCPRALDDIDRSSGNETTSKEEWLDEVLKALDMALILTGAPGRETLIEKLIITLQQHIQDSQQPPKKRRKLEGKLGTFPAAKIDKRLEVSLIGDQIPSVAHLTLSGFERHLKDGGPLVIQGVLTQWPAMQERLWSDPAYLMQKTFGGRRLVPVELGRSYTDAGWGQSIVTFKEFMEKYLLDPSRTEDQNIGYLAQHDLFAQIPSLRSDISIPDFCYATLPPQTATQSGSHNVAPSQLEEPLLNAWFGPAGTVSPLHTDPYHNILCQVVGKKYIRLYSPTETDRLYPKGVEDGGIDMSNTSEVDAEAAGDILDTKFPLFLEAKYIETILSEGECLYIPVGWWHYVRSLTISFSVSFWWN
ncbi:MAG: hypothetical protein LQ342_001802 [Letrouitia transgressa]|nr:MAG: hypothetical protein LQ342_001802 [Letrouitia transgressa]